MDVLVELQERPVAKEMYMIAGWRQWADAGEVSSGLPRYLIDLAGARKIGEIKPGDFYLFQIPGTHHLMRPKVKLVNGHRESMSAYENDFYYAEFGQKGLLVFLGDEPHKSEARYANAFFDVAEALQVNRIVIVGGVFGAMPYDKDREISCVYSLPGMKDELASYSVRFSSYEGGTTIGAYLASQAEARGIEVVVFHAFAPAYEFSQLGITVRSMRMEEDWKAWYDIMRRVEYMFHLGLDLSDLEEHSRDLIETWDGKIQELEQKHPELHVRAYLEAAAKDFREQTFIPLDEAWDELGDLFQDMEDSES